MESSDYRGDAANRGGTISRGGATSRGVTTNRGRDTSRESATGQGGATSHGDRDRDFRQYQPFSMVHANFNSPTRLNFRDGSRPSTSAESLPERGVDHKPNGGENEDSSHRGKYNKSEASQEDDTSNDENTEKSDYPTEAMHTGDVADDPQDDEVYTKRGKQQEGRYQGVSNYLLHCFLCNKNMLDGKSFQTHVYGKGHQQMLNQLKQIFQNIINMLRERISLDEEKKVIKLERKHHNIVNYHRIPQQEYFSYCKMCDLKFFGKMIDHRENKGHQRLKSFMHPSCNYCSQTFSSRLQWVTHHFTPNHLQKITEIKEDDEGNMPIIEEICENIKDLYDDGIPAYKSTQEVGVKNGFYCDLCICWLMDEGTVQNHLQSEEHYNACVAAAKSKLKKMQDEKKEKEMQKYRWSEEKEEKTENPTSVKFEESNANNDKEYSSKESYQDNIVSLDEVPDDEELTETIDLIQAVGNENNLQGEDVVSGDEENYHDNNECLVETSYDEKCLECTDDEDKDQNKVAASDDKKYYLEKSDQDKDASFNEVLDSTRPTDLIIAIGGENNTQGKYVNSGNKVYGLEGIYRDKDALLNEVAYDEECNDDVDKVFGEDIASVMYDLKEAGQVNGLSLDDIHEDQEFTEPIDLVQAVSDDNVAHNKGFISGVKMYGFKKTCENEDVSLDEITDDQKFAETINLVQAVGGENNTHGEDVTSGDEVYGPEENYQDKDAFLHDDVDKVYGENIASEIYDLKDFKESCQVNNFSLDEIHEDQELAEPIDLVQAVSGDNRTHGKGVTNGNKMCGSREAHQDQDVSLNETFDDEEFLDCNDVEDKVQEEEVADQDNWILQETEINWGLFLSQ